MSLSSSDALTLISRYESNDKNVLNTQGSTASGYYQIINGTWQQYAPGQGVDLNRYPTAMSAPRDVQTSVATAIYNARGFQPWSSNQPLMAAVSGADPTATGTGATGTGSGTGSGPTGSGTSGTTATGGATQSAPATGWAAQAWEIVQRGSVIIFGSLLVLLALAALLWESKGTRMAVQYAKGGGAS